VALLACKPPKNTGSKDLASARGVSGQYLRCGTILPSVEEVAIKSLGTMVRYAKTGGSHALARTVSQNTVNMLENMMRSPTKPIHPVAFYAAVKDFESASSLKWSKKSGNSLDYFRTGNCTSGECFGMFQVDVKLESAWRGGAFCQSDGLNLWSTTAGGGDFCAAQFWWTVAEGGQKCAALTGFVANPCTSPGYTWTLSEVRKGRAAYVQAIQSGWDNNAWSEMYQNYEKCYTDKMPLAQAIAEFKDAIGLSSSTRSLETWNGTDTYVLQTTRPGADGTPLSPTRDADGSVIPAVPTIQWDKAFNTDTDWLE
jgi:hypothetical protein